MKDRTIDPKNIDFQNKSLICSVNGWNIEKPYWSSVRDASLMGCGREVFVHFLPSDIPYRGRVSYRLISCFHMYPFCNRKFQYTYQ